MRSKSVLLARVGLEKQLIFVGLCLVFDSKQKFKCKTVKQMVNGLQVMSPFRVCGYACSKRIYIIH